MVNDIDVFSLSGSKLFNCTVKIIQLLYFLCALEWYPTAGENSGVHGTRACQSDQSKWRNYGKNWRITTT